MIYLDNAATTLPKPPQVAQAMAEGCRRFGNPGRSGHAASLEAGQAIYNCRVALAGLMNADDPFRMIFCLNCTDALNLAIKGMLAQGGHVVTTALEHNSVLRPLYALREGQKISLSIIYPRSSGYLEPNDIAAEISPATRLVVVTQASNVTGAVQPVGAIAEVCARRNVPLLVDGAQALGCMPVDLQSLGMCMYAFPGHKGLLGPQGTGGVYIHPSCSPLPLREGGTGSASLSLSQPQDLPDRYESGTSASPAIAGLWAGVQYVQKNIKAIQNTEEHLTGELWDGLKSINGLTLYGPPPGSPRVGVVTFNLANLQASEAADALALRYNVACRAGLHCAPLAHRFLGTQEKGTIRMSVGPFNTSGDIKAAVRAVAMVARGH